MLKETIETNKSSKVSIQKPDVITEKCWNLTWRYIILIFICCLLIICINGTSSTITRLLGLQSINVKLNNSTFFTLKYETNVINGNSFGLIDTHLLQNKLMKKWQLTGLIIYNAQFISSSIDNTIQTNHIQYKKEKTTKGNTFVLSFSIENPIDCISIDCINNFVFQINDSIAYLNQNMKLSITFIDDQTIDVQFKFLSNQQLAEEQINKLLHINSSNKQNHQQSKRQVSESTTPKTNTTSNSGSLVDIPTPIFFPKFIGNFQLALKSNTSTVVIIGNDYNIYLSAQYLSKTQPSTFSLYDLQLSNQTAVAIIRDASNNRYLHTYNDIQTKGYSRVRTHLDTYMPCGSNIMFWMFVRGYLQFYRGGAWSYDTAGCLDPLTGLVKIWIINGQQGLTALQAKYQTCGLAPLIPINYI